MTYLKNEQGFLKVSREEFRQCERFGLRSGKIKEENEHFSNCSDSWLQKVFFLLAIFIIQIVFAVFAFVYIHLI